MTGKQSGRPVPPPALSRKALKSTLACFRADRVHRSAHTIPGDEDSPIRSGESNKPSVARGPRGVELHGVPGVIWIEEPGIYTPAEGLLATRALLAFDKRRKRRAAGLVEVR